MIAENVKGTLFGSISEGLYSAYVSSSAISNRSAYVVTRKKIKEYFDGVVIAVAEFEGLEGERLIVSQPGEVFYEPELRNLLSKLKNITIIQGNIHVFNSVFIFSGSDNFSAEQLSQFGISLNMVKMVMCI